MPLNDPTWIEEIEQAVETFVLIDADDRIIYSGHPSERIESSAGAPVSDFVSAEHGEVLRQRLEIVRSTGVPQHVELEATTSTGVTSFYGLWIMPVGDQFGDGSVGMIATDITASRRSDAIELTEATLRSLVENAPDIFMIVDRERRVVFLNRFEGGFSEEVIGTMVETYIPSNDRDMVVDAVMSVFETGESTSYETALDAPDGRRYYETRVGPIILDGVVERASLVSTDITSRREAEHDRERLSAQLLQAQKMDALGQLTGGVAHDFNNLLMAIGGNLQLLQLEQELEPGPATRVAESMRAVERATELTQRLLMFSRKHPLAPQVANVNALVGNMLAILRRTLGADVQVDADLGVDLWSCTVDHGQLEQAILNLAVNARDAMPAGGRLEIATSNVTVDSDQVGDGRVPLGDYIAINVGDDGDGMTTEVVSQAFEPFFTTKPLGKGTGLGLSTVYGFVAQSGGWVILDSSPGEGTNVRILLPRTESVQPTSDGGASPPTPPAQAATGVVLIVEDQPQVRDLSARLIERLGYRVLVAGDSDEALRLLAADGAADGDSEGAQRGAREITIMFTDVGLPGELNGFELAQRVAMLRPDVPVVFTSGYPEGAGVTSAQADIDLLRKPYTLEQLGQALGRADARRT